MVAGDGRGLGVGGLGVGGLRVDAARNHERIVTTAAQVFEDEGASVPLDEIARRAGVGVATLYRRFGGRDQLVRAVFDHVFATEIEPAVVETGLDPWRDLVDTITGTVAAVAAHRVLVGLARDMPATGLITRTPYIAAVERVLGRARDAGLVRAELTVRDIAAIVVMALAVVRVSGHDEADTHRYLALLADGMRPAPAPLPAGSPPKP